MARIQIGPESIYYTNHGRSDCGETAEVVLVFIHGSGGSHKSWPIHIRSAVAVPVLTASAYLLDLPGHGRSTGQGRETIEAYAEFIDDFVTALSLHRVILVGHSLGGAITLQVALRQPSWLAGLVLVGTGARLRVHPDILNRMHQHYADTIDLVCQRAFGPDASKALVEGSRQALLETDPDVTWKDFTACNVFNIVSRLGEIVYPSLIVSGAVDHLTPPEYGVLLNKEIKDSKYRVIEQAGHMMALEKPDVFLSILAAFVSELDIV